MYVLKTTVRMIVFLCLLLALLAHMVVRDQERKGLKSVPNDII